MERETQTFSMVIELPDEPGQLLSALKPIAENNGNLLSIVHERGNLTPRNTLPVQIYFSCHQNQYLNIKSDLEDNGITIQQSELESYDRKLTVIIFGPDIESKFSELLTKIRETCCQENVPIEIVQTSLKTPDKENTNSSFRLEVGIRSEYKKDVLTILRDVTEKKGLRLVEPMEQ